MALAAVFMLAATFGLVLGRHLSITGTTALRWPSSSASRSALERRAERFRLMARYLAVASVLSWASFLFLSASTAADLAVRVRRGRGGGRDIGTDRRPRPRRGTPDGHRPPRRHHQRGATSNFARGRSVDLVPQRHVGRRVHRAGRPHPLLTGQFHERGQAPTSIDHPRNIFTLIGEAYDVHALESVTQLLPPGPCALRAPVLRRAARRRTRAAFARRWSTPR